MKGEVNISEIIESITPLNNQWREEKSPLNKLLIMWKIGEILFLHGIKKIHPIAWEIQKRSYITRDFISYCYRIRRKWPDENEIKIKFHSLKSYTTFREALPLIENERYKLSENEIEKLIWSLNNEDPRVLKSKLVEFKKKYIGFENPRTQRLSEVKEFADTFNRMYNEIHAIVKNNDLKRIKEIRIAISDQGLLTLSQCCLSLSQEGILGPKNINYKDWPQNFIDFIKALIFLINQKKEVRQRFRRHIEPSKILLMADIFNSIRSDQEFENLRNRLFRTIKLHSTSM